jgi:aldose 1-epimerase
MSPAAATVYEASTGRVMEVFTDQPGVQFYTGNFLNGSIRGLGGTYNRHGGFCLETQDFPSAPHHPKFPSIILRPGETYRQFGLFKFSTRQ